jgi:hypothetical protein
MHASVSLDPLDGGYRSPLRANSAHESNRLVRARRDGPFVAWRGGTDEIRITSLRPGEPIRIGRSPQNTIVIDDRMVSREHAEILVREPGTNEVSVLLVDLASRNGTWHRRLAPDYGGEHAAGALRRVPASPAAPIELLAGDHDIVLAERAWLRIGGVPVDTGSTDELEQVLPPPTPRERDVLVELCRPRYVRQGATSPSNAQIGARLVPAVGASWVSDILSRLYVKYGLSGTKEQNRIALANLAIANRLVRPDDFM